MAQISEYLTQLAADKQTLVDTLVAKGIEATNDQTFTELVPMVNDVSGGEQVYINDASYLFSSNTRINQVEELLSICRDISNTSYMFYNSSKLTTIDVSNFDTSEVTNMGFMFYSCGINSIDVSNFNTLKVTNMQSMFNNCKYLKNIDISSFDTSNLNSSAGMFNNCSSLETLIINNPNIFKMTHTSMLTGSSIASGTGYVYVPDDMVDTYKSATNWSTYAAQIKGMSELPQEHVHSIVIEEVMNGYENELGCYKIVTKCVDCGDYIEEEIIPHEEAVKTETMGPFTVTTHYCSRCNYVISTEQTMT